MKDFNSSILFRVFWTCGIFLLVAIGMSTITWAQNADDASRVWEDNPYGIKVTRDPSNTPLSGYDEWVASHPEKEYRVTTAKTYFNSTKDTDDRVFGIIVNADLLPNIQSSIDQYQIDLAADGFTSTVYSMSGGTPDTLRLFLTNRYLEGMEGAILIGDLPVAWYEADCWDPVEHEEFPFDYFYMDLDGSWEDIDFDGKYDFHSGSIAPDIWIGRLTASPLTYNGANEVDLLQNYFEKNHRYRTGQMIFEDRALAFIEDDWSSSGWENDVARAYDSVVAVIDDYQTTAPNYSIELVADYESILICAHSSPNTHWFTTPSGNWTTLNYDEIVTLNPIAGFYNMFNCSSSRYTSTNFLGGWYIFTQGHGLATIGSTKTGSMLNFNLFYPYWNQGLTYGESFANWLTDVGNDGMAGWEICWFYGMTLNGDPTLTKSPFSAPEIVVEQLHDGMYSEEYTYTFSASGGILPYTWSIANGNCPDSLTMNSETGEISGVIHEINDFTYYVQVEDASSPPHSDLIRVDFHVDYLCGDANNDKSVNIADAVFIINFAFKGGPSPVLAETSDANCSFDTNVGDAVYIINYSFKGGPAPCCP